MYWQRICKDLNRHRITKIHQARLFFEKWFFPYKILTSRGSSIGLFTGYYEVSIDGSYKRTRKFRYPIYSPPKTLSSHKGKKHLSHSSIAKGSLNGKGLEFLWVSDKARLFSMHVQGSGRIRVSKNRYIRIGYAGANGFPYTSIGPYFKHYPTGRIGSVLDMIEWLNKNPRYASEIMQKNQSYIFFKKSNVDAVLGAQNVPLTPERSIAIDNRIYPYGAPMWIDTSLPKTRKYTTKKYQRLMIAQDKGGAIKGAIRADIFFGGTSKAEELSSYMNNKGGMYIFIPKAVKMHNSYVNS